MERIRVDFNSLGQDGMLKAHLRGATGPLRPGDFVEAWEDDMEYELEVVSVENDIVRMFRP